MYKRTRVEFKDINLDINDYNLYDLTEDSPPPPPPPPQSPPPNRMGDDSKYVSSSYKSLTINNDELKKEMDELLIQEGELKLLLTKIRRKIKELAVKRGMV